MHDKLHNNKTIFDYLSPTYNDMLSNIPKGELFELLEVLNKYYLEYRENLGFGNQDTFGIEIEIEHFKCFKQPAFVEFQMELYKLIKNTKWDVRNDTSLFNGREIVSDVLRDNPCCWDEIDKACLLAYKNGSIDINSSSHIHVGAQILGDNSIYWYRLFKLWSIYENIIYRFSYGEYLSHRQKIEEYAIPAALFFSDRLKLLNPDLNYSLLEMLNIIEPIGFPEKYTKKFGISYWKMLADNNYDDYNDYNKFNLGCTVEFRCLNPTLDKIVWQNNINFFVKMMLYCKSDKYDDDIINRRKSVVEEMFSDLSLYSNIYLEQVLELSDMIFDNNLDKVYFLRQYLKSFEITDKPFVKAKKFTNNLFK